VGPPCLPTTHITPHESHHSSSPLLLRQQPHSYRSSSAVFCRDSTWPHFRACHWNFQHTHEDKRLISHLEWQITDLQGRKTSPSVPLRDSTWPHFRACHWSFQHTYEDKRLIPHHEWRITDLQGREIIPLSSPSGFHMATLSCMPLELSTHLRGLKGSSPTLSGGSPTSRVERSSPSVTLRDSTWPHFSCIPLEFSTHLRGHEAYPHHEWRITELHR